MDGNEKITVQYLGVLFASNQGEGPLYEDVKKHFESANAAELYNAATREGATNEDKIKWAVYSLELHKKLNVYLTDINKKAPELFAEDTIANINDAYAVNTHLCADAITKDPEGLVQTLVNQSYDKLTKLGNYDPNGANAAAYEDELARLLYLGKLKYELQIVHGSAEEMKSWKAEILTELMSDDFEKNAAQYKNSEIYKGSREKLVNNPNMEPEEAIQTAILGIAEEKYHSVYYTFYNVTNKEEDKQKVIQAADEIEEMKALANTVGVSRGGNENKVEMEFNPHLDTVFMKRSANLYGMQEDYIGSIIRLKEADNRKLERIQSRIDDEWKKFRVKNQKRLDEGYATINEAKRVKGILNQIAVIEEEINGINAEIKKLSENPENKAINTNNKLEAKEQDKADSSFLKSIFSGFSPFKAKESGKSNPEKEVKLEEQETPLQKKFKELIEKQNEKGKLLSSVYGKHGSVNDKYYIAMIKSDQAYEEYIKNEQRKADRRIEEDLRYDFEPIRKEVKEREIALESEMEARELKKKLDDIVKRANENKEYEQALRNKDVEKIKEIKQSRLSRDIDAKKETPNFYNIKYVMDENREYHVFFQSKPTAKAKADMEQEFLKYKENNKVSEEKQKEFEDKQKDFENKDKQYQEISPIARPDRKGITINAFKAPAVAELNLDNIAVEENVTYKYQEKEQVIVHPDLSNPTAQITFALECAQKKAKVAFGTKEYDDILDGLLEAKALADKNADAKTELIPLLKKLDVQMEHYIERKDDQIRRGKDSRTTKERRSNIVDAQESVRASLYSLMEKNHVSENDYACEEALYELENVEKLTKEQDPEVTKIKEALQKKDMMNALELMNGFMAKRVHKYNHDGKYNFLRGLSGEDTKGRYNIPSKADERYYKSILTQCNKLLQVQLEEFQKNDPFKLEVLKFNLKYSDSDHIRDKVGLKEKYGITFNPDYFVLKNETGKKDNFADYSKQFANHYSGLAAKMRCDGLARKIQDPGNYNVGTILSVEERHYMNEAALSSMFLEKNYKNKEFDFKQTEEERVKFISLVKSTNLFDRINMYGLKIHDLEYVDGNPKELRDFSRESLLKIKEPKDYAKEVVAKAVKDEVMELFDKATKSVGKEDGYDANEAKKSIKDLELMCKLGKALGLSDSLVKANNAIPDEKLKGKDIEESVKNLKEANESRIVSKHIAPVAKL